VSTPQPQEFLPGRPDQGIRERRREASWKGWRSENGSPRCHPELNAALAKAQIRDRSGEIKRDRRVTVVRKDAAKEPSATAMPPWPASRTWPYRSSSQQVVRSPCLPASRIRRKGLSIPVQPANESGETLDGEWPIAGPRTFKPSVATHLPTPYILAALLGIAAEEDDDAWPR